MKNNSLEQQNDGNKSQDLLERNLYPDSLTSTEKTTSAIQEQILFDEKNVEQNTLRDKIDQIRNISTSNSLQEIPPSTTKSQHQSFSPDFETREAVSNHKHNRTTPTVRPVYIPPTTNENNIVKEPVIITSTPASTCKRFLIPDKRSTPTTTVSTAPTTTISRSTTIATATTRRPHHQPFVLLNNSKKLRSSFPELVLICLIYKMV